MSGLDGGTVGLDSGWVVWWVQAVMWVCLTVVVVVAVALVSATLAGVLERVRGWLPTRPMEVSEMMDEVEGGEAAWVPLDEQARAQWAAWGREEMQAAQVRELPPMTVEEWERLYENGPEVGPEVPAWPTDEASPTPSTSAPTKPTQ